MQPSRVLNLYYGVKPLIPRQVQIAFRRAIVRRKLIKHAGVWPITREAAKPPDNWTGWPDRKRFALILTHDVDTVRGLARCDLLADLEASLGFKSSFNFVAEGYTSSMQRSNLNDRGFEVGVHGVTHNGNPFRSKKTMQVQVLKINRYLNEWGAVGFRCPSMFHDMDCIGKLNILYDSSRFDTDPFEPQPDGVKTIFPFWVPAQGTRKGYVELPYTLPQDFTLFILMKEHGTGIWRKKLDWIAESRGMALVNSHPDYMSFREKTCRSEEYPHHLYEDFLQYVKTKYANEYWHVLPREMASLWSSRHCNNSTKAGPWRPCMDSASANTGSKGGSGLISMAVNDL